MQAINIRIAERNGARRTDGRCPRGLVPVNRLTAAARRKVARGHCTRNLRKTYLSNGHKAVFTQAARNEILCMYEANIDF